MKKWTGIFLMSLLAVVLLCSVCSGAAKTAQTPLALAGSAGEDWMAETDTALALRLNSLISMNAVFDDCMTDGAALVDAASGILIQQAAVQPDGSRAVPAASVSALISDLYGVQVDLSTLPAAYTQGLPAGYLRVMDHEANPMSQTLTGACLQEDGTVAATASLEYAGKALEVHYTFAADSDSPFGYVILAADIDQAPTASYGALSFFSH